MLDADEQLPPPTRAELRACLARADAAGLMGLRCCSATCAPRASDVAGRICRWSGCFARSPTVRYEGRIHEQIRPRSCARGGRIGATEELYFCTAGYGGQTAQGGVARARRNLDLLEEALRDAPDDAYLLYQLGATCKAIGDPCVQDTLERALAINARQGQAARRRGDGAHEARAARARPWRRQRGDRRGAALPGAAAERHRAAVGDRPAT